MKARTARRGDAGATIVEGALVAPIFLLLLFGVFEFGLALRDYMALQSGTHAAVRVASTNGNDVDTDAEILLAFADGSKALESSSTVTTIVVWKASGPDDSLSPSSPCLTGSVAGLCNRYVAGDLSRSPSDFGCAVGGPDTAWCPDTRNVRLSDPPDYVGVTVAIVHSASPGIFGSTRDFTAEEVMRLEPQRL